MSDTLDVGGDRAMSDGATDRDTWEQRGYDNRSAEPSKLALKGITVSAADGGLQLRAGAPMIVSGDGNTIVAGLRDNVWGSSAYLDEAMFVLFHRDKDTGLFVQSDALAAESFHSPSGTDGYWLIGALTAIQGESRAYFVAEACWLAPYPPRGTPLTLLGSIEWDAETGAVLSVQEHEVDFGGCSTTAACLYLLNEMAIIEDGPTLYVTGLRKLTAGNSDSWDAYILGLDLSGATPKLVHQIHAWPWAWAMTWSDDETVLLRVTGMDDLEAYVRQPGNADLELLFSFQPLGRQDEPWPPPTYDFFLGSPIGRGVGAREFYQTTIAAHGECMRIALETLVVCEDDECDGAEDTLDWHPSSAVCNSECNLCTEQNDKPVKDPSWWPTGMAVSPGGKLVALLGQTKPQETVLLFRRDERSYEVPFFQELLVDAGGLPGYDLRTDCTPGNGTGPMVFSPNGLELFVICSVYPLDAPEDDCCDTALFHFQAVPQ